MAQCNRCIHSDVCRYSDRIAALKEENPFIKDITCNYQVYGENPKPVKKQVVSKPQAEPKADGQENPDDPKAELKSLPLDSLKMPQDFNEAMESIGIKAIGEIYTYEAGHKWAESGIGVDNLKLLNGKLEAFGLPALQF